MTLSTDIIVGFPGETEADFQATLDMVREIGFTSLFAFKYSQRPFTPALKLPDDVTEEEKSERLARLFEVAEALTRAYLETLVGTSQSVLVEGPSKASAKEGRAFVEGRTLHNAIVHVEAPAGLSLVGEVVDVTVARANKHSLFGDLTEACRARLSARAPLARTAPVEKRRRALPLL